MDAQKAAELVEFKVSSRACKVSSTVSIFYPYVYLLLLLLLCSPAISLGWFLHKWPYFNPTIEIVTFLHCGWYMLGVFLLPAFTRLGLECLDVLSLCYGITMAGMPCQKKKKKKKKKKKADLTTVLHIRELPHLHMKLAVWFSFLTTNNKNLMIPSWSLVSIYNYSFNPDQILTKNFEKLELEICSKIFTCGMIFQKSIAVSPQV